MVINKTIHKQIKKRIRDRKYQKEHKGKVNKKNLDYYYKNKQNVLASFKKSILKVKYGLAIEDFNLLYNNQKGRCAICGKHQSELKKPLGVDHNHRTSQVRGLLCSACNIALGILKTDDTLDLVYKVLDYLKV